MAWGRGGEVLRWAEGFLVASVALLVVEEIEQRKKLWGLAAHYCDEFSCDRLF